MAFDPSKVDWAKVSASGTVIAVELARGTDTPLDDMLAPFAGELIARLVQQFIVPRMAGGELTAEEVRAEFAARGYSGPLQDWLVALIIRAGRQLLDELLARFFPQ